LEGLIVRRCEGLTSGAILRWTPWAGLTRSTCTRSWRRSMPLRVSGRNISVGAALQKKITDRVEAAASKYFRGGYSGRATVGRDGFGFRTECILHLDSGALLEAEGTAPDAYESA